MPMVAEKKKEGKREERSMPIVVEKRGGKGNEKSAQYFGHINKKEKETRKCLGS